MNNEAFDRLMYALTKEAARNSFVEFLETWEISNKDYAEIKKHLNEAYGVKTYV